MSHAYLLWVIVGCYALHIMEEFMLGWKNWAQRTLGLKGVLWHHFYVGDCQNKCVNENN